MLVYDTSKGLPTKEMDYINKDKLQKKFRDFYELKALTLLPINNLNFLVSRLGSGNSIVWEKPVYTELLRAESLPCPSSHH